MNCKSLFGETTNIGMNSEISIGDLVSLIAKIMDTDITISSTNERIRPKSSEVERLVCDNTKLTNNTSWKPNYTLAEGIGEVIEWMKNPKNLTMYKAEQYNV